MFKPKAAKKEYEKYMLPKNRREVFFDVIKLNWIRFLLYGCLIMVISLPIHISAILEDMYKIHLSSALSTGKMTETEAAVLASSSSNTLALVNIVLLVIFAAGFSGLAHVIRQHAWEESVYFRYEYVKGIRQNAGSFMLLGLLTGLVHFFCVWFQNILLMSGSGGYDYVRYLPTVWFGILGLPPAAYLTVCIPIYKVKFYQNVKTALMLYFKNFLRTLLAIILCGAVFLLKFVPNLYFHIIGRLVSSLVVPFIALGWFLFTYDRLDETINKKMYPQLVGRGILQEEDGS